MGLAPILVQEIFVRLRQLNEEGVTIFLVEQNAHMALDLVSRAYILQAGRIVMAGGARELAEDENVRRIYLGEE